MPLGNGDLRSDRTRSPGAVLLDDPEASHAYAWLFKHQPATIEEYVETVDANELQAELAVLRLHGHGLIAETDAGYEAEPVDEVVEGVRVTPGVAAIVANQLENYAVRKLVRRHGSLPLARAAEYWPQIQHGTLESRDLGEKIGIGQHDGVTATNALRAVEDVFELDPYFDEVGGLAGTA